MVNAERHHCSFMMITGQNQHIVNYSHHQPKKPKTSATLQNLGYDIQATRTKLTMNQLLETMYMVTVCLSMTVQGILMDQAFQAQNSSVFPACIHTYQDIERITPHSQYCLLNHQIDVSVQSFSASMTLQRKHTSQWCNKGFDE